ncbi:MAG: DUF2092 domain-containing protein [Thiohalocapsa sp.]
MGERRLYPIGDRKRWPKLEPTFGENVRLREIEAQWDEILRAASSIRLGTVTASLLVRKLASYPRQNRLALAMRELGRIERTLFLLLSAPYEALMLDVVDVKDLGSGVIGGVECNHLAFRAKEVDWQIWIAQVDQPYPCRYVIRSTFMDGEPEYSIQIRDWKAGDEVAATDFTFKNPTDAKQVDPKDLKGTDALPAHFQIGEAQ